MSASQPASRPWASPYAMLEAVYRSQTIVRPAASQASILGFGFVAVGDVQQLHHVGRVVALPVQRPVQLRADRRRVVGKRESLAGRAGGRQRRGKRIGLGLFPTLIEAFERDQGAAHPVHSSSATRSSMV